MLAGPVVRRSSPEQANVWMATRLPLPLGDGAGLQLYLDDAATLPIATVSTSVSVQLGVGLHAHMLTATPTQGELPFDHVLAYDVVTADGRRLGDLIPLARITLQGARLPTFVLNDPTGVRLHALYASCRKLHGPNPDMAPALRHVLERAPDGRPSLLFLGGDQIYADDVDGTLLPSITQLAATLVGRPGPIPRLSRYAAQGRGAFLDRISGGDPLFTSSEKDFHLFTFGEYAATYLLAWTAEAWVLASELRGTDVVTLFGGSPRLMAAFAGAAAMRRVLANTVTYMTFDDHEITDDWFLNLRWRQRAMENDTTRRIILNGMAAYWAFQGWGNEPAAFPDAFRRRVGEFTRTGAGEAAAGDELLAPGRWSFVAPTGPPTLFLDTRTGREDSPAVDDLLPIVAHERGQRTRYADGRNTLLRPRDRAAPRLLGERERARLKELLADVAVAGDPLVIVAASPVLGLPAIEEVQEGAGRVGLSTEGDVESWAANPRNLSDLVELTHPLDPRPLVVLSGDVHYGFELAASVSTAGRTMPVAQFCSSAAKNRLDGAHLAGAGFLLWRARHALGRAAMAWWVITRTGDHDGPVARYHPDPRDPDFEALTRRHGRPTFVVAERFVEDRPHGIIEKLNNVGELVIDGGTVQHRLWRTDRGRHTADELRTWSVPSWPVPRTWPM